jgi:hypothetical protein
VFLLCGKRDDAVAIVTEHADKLYLATDTEQWPEGDWPDRLDVPCRCGDGHHLIRTHRIAAEARQGWQRRVRI